MSYEDEIASNSSESSLSSVEEDFGSDDEDLSINYGAIEPYRFEPENSSSEEDAEAREEEPLAEEDRRDNLDW